MTIESEAEIARLTTLVEQYKAESEAWKTKHDAVRATAVELARELRLLRHAYDELQDQFDEFDPVTEVDCHY